jgi:multidrug efflux pump subunit AcrB
VPLSVVANLTESRDQATLMRIDGQQAATVEARADTAEPTPIQARRRVDRELVPELLAKYPGLSVEPEGGVRDERAMLETLGLLVPVVLVVSMVGGLVLSGAFILFVLPTLVMIAEGARE